ncbi:MAG: amino acid adenylation domain-containing protein [Gemmatimonadales bacterium]
MRNGDPCAPLTFAQSRWWFLNQLEQDAAPLHNWVRATRLTGPLEVPVLARSLEEVVRRHQTLRTRVLSIDGEPVQEPVPAGPFPLPVTDLSSHPRATRDDEARRLAAQELFEPFDLASGRLLRAALLRLGAEEHVLVLGIHHITSDGWSMQLLLRELVTLYTAFAGGRPSPLPELPIQYTDYARWQRDHFQGATLERELTYWREQLRDAPPVLELPTDRPRPKVQTYAGAQLSFVLPARLVDALTGLARRERASLFMVLLAGFKSLLWRYTGQTDLVVGVPTAGRTRVELESLIGCLANALVLRTDLAGDPSFRELLARVRTVAMGAYAHQDLPFEKLVEELQPDRSVRHHPVFQVMFNFRDFPPATVEIPGVRLEDLKVERGTALFDLSLALVRGPEGITCGFGYSTDLFDAATIARLGAHYQALLESAVAQPDRRLSETSSWSDAERRQVLYQWNATARDYPLDRCVHQLFERQAALAPSSVALLSDDQRVTYGELNRRSNQLAHHLRRLGVGPEVRVGLCLERSVEMVVGLLAVLKAGGAYVPLDPAYPRERLAFMLEDARASILLAQDRQVEGLPRQGLRVVVLDSEGWSFAGESGDDPASGVGADNLAYVMYTSGSTGRPKGVMVCHRSVVNHLRWRDEYFPVSPADRGIQKASLSFDDSVWEIFEPLLAGAQLVLAPPGAQSDSAQLVRLIAERRITTACFVPSLLQVFLEEPKLGDCVSLRRVTTGGEALSMDLQERFFSRLGARLHNGYGPTEATISATFWTCERDGHRRSVPIGRPIANTTTYVLDRYFQPVPIGVPGELCIGGAGLARGYLGRAGLTAERFVPDPFGEGVGGRLYRTGDLARYLPDGTLEFLGRLDGQVKLRGNRVEPGEVEAVLRQHPAVRECVALAREDRPGERRLVAYVVPHQAERDGSAPAAPAGVRDEHVAQWRARYEEIYRESASSVADPAFDTTGWTSSYTGQAIPSTEMHEWVGHTVARIRHLEPRRVLEIGCGTGLLLLRLAPHCEAYVGTDFSPTVLRSLAARLEAAGHTPGVTLLQREASDFTDMTPGCVDLVVINSVTQYLPGIDHLFRVIENAADVVAPGGSIFVGDVRNFDLLETFHTSVEMFRAEDAVTTEELRERIGNRVSAESELAISPAFFAALPAHLPKIDRVEVALKRGRSDNELTRFRYDVTLWLRPSSPSANPGEPVSAVDWETGEWDLDRVRTLLTEVGSPAIYLEQVPNARVQDDAHAVELLDRLDLTTVARLREAIRTAPGANCAVAPEDFWALGAELGYSVEVAWPGGDSRGRYDVLLWRSGSARPALARWQGASAPAERSWSRYANTPLAKSASRSLMSELRQHLAERLPDYMVPQSIVALDALPLTPSGKIDRRALPEPGRAQSVPARYQPPSTPAETVIADIWAVVLKLERVGIQDNFFELGGHSLLATQAMSRIRQAFQVDMPLRAIFEAPTVASLAAALPDRSSNGSSDAAERFLRELDELSDEEAERLLAAEAGGEDA